MKVAKKTVIIRKRNRESTLIFLVDRTSVQSRLIPDFSQIRSLGAERYRHPLPN